MRRLIPRRGWSATITSSQKCRISSALFPANSVFDSLKDALVTLKPYLAMRPVMVTIGVV